MKRSIVYGLLSIAFLASCVPLSKLENEKNANDSLTEANERCGEKLAQAMSQVEGLNGEIEEFEALLKAFEEDTTRSGEAFRQLALKHEKLNELYDQLINRNKNLLDKNALRTQKLSSELEAKQIALSRQEGKLKSLEGALKVKEQNITTLSKDLEAREKRVKELEDMLRKRNEAAAALKKKIKDALLGFANDELTVEEKNGKIYVSMAAKLLFKSGKTDVDPKGIDALKKLAVVLNKNAEIQITVEGHTDNQEMNPAGCIKNNWQLSVLRATSISNILIGAKVDAKRITASGRGPYYPIADNGTKDGMAKNRRTEIILSPDLSDLFELLGE